jgi:hypothetical protein
MKMRRILAALLLACITTVAMGSTPYQSLNIEISHPESKREAESGVVVFTMTNPSDRVVNVLKLQTPFNTTGERLTNNLFDVVDGRGEEAKYTGIYVGMVAGNGAIDKKYFIALKPGESLSKSIDLSKSYDLSTGGSFKVTFKRAVLGEPANGVDSAKTLEQSVSEVASNTLDVWINTAFPLGQSVHILDAPQNAVCEASQQAVIDAALTKAKSLAFDATQYTGGLEYFEGEGDTFTVKLKEDFRRNNWFGSHDPNWLPVSDAGWMDTENFYPTVVSSAIEVRLGGPLSDRSLSFDCSCPPEWGANDLTAAVALANQKIGICPKFFTLEDNGFDTKAGALIHETAHFSDDLAKGAVDTRYGTGPSAQLAKDDKSAAMRNADSYKYFMESGGL